MGCLSEFSRFHWAYSAHKDASLRRTGTPSQVGQTLGASQTLKGSDRGSWKRRDSRWVVNWDEEEEAKTWVGHLASERGMGTSGPAGDQPARGLESSRKLQLPSVDA